MRKMLLAALIAIPVFYYFALIVGAATYPGYSHVTRYASELGAAGAPFPALFNYSIVAGGIAAMLGAVGLADALHDLSRRRRWAIPAGLTLAMWGAGMVMGGLFPMPDERHGGFGLGFAGPLTPLFTLLALWAVPGTAAIRAFLALIFAGSVVLLSIMMGVGGLVTIENVGIWQRVNSGLSIPWLAVIGVWLLGRAARRGKAAPA